MFELTNDQRRCFGLAKVEESWVRITAKPSPYHDHTTVAYLDGNTLRRFIRTGENIYTEYEICEQLSDDGRYLLPKTAKGKPVLFTAANLEKRSGIGMCVSFSRQSRGYNHLIGFTYLDIYSHDSQKCYYANSYEYLYTSGIDWFADWVENWCGETTPEDLADIAAFAAEPRQHVKFREGDVFRFKINRRLWGYGRVLLDYAKMRKEKQPMWDVLMGKPTACSVYHIITKRKDLTIDELKSLKSLPSVHMMDNRLYYGDFEIIGNIPIGEREDYPIMYGDSISAREKGLMLQCGKLYRKLESEKAFSYEFRNHIIGFDLRFKLPVLQQCIEEKSNAPFWAQHDHYGHRDLRNPKFRAELDQAAAQFGLDPADICVTYKE